jgi:hypothetical protein
MSVKAARSYAQSSPTPRQAYSDTRRALGVAVPGVHPYHHSVCSTARRAGDVTRRRGC